MLRHFRFQYNFKVITIIIDSQLCSCTELWLSPDVSEEVPCKSPNRLPPALLIAAILEIIGRLWMTKATSFFCCWARFRAWPMIPKPVMSVAACALNLCIKAAAGERKKTFGKQYKTSCFGLKKKKKKHIPNLSKVWTLHFWKCSCSPMLHLLIKNTVKTVIMKLNYYNKKPFQSPNLWKILNIPNGVFLKIGNNLE